MQASRNECIHYGLNPRQHEPAPQVFSSESWFKIPRQSNQEDLGTILLSMMPLKWQTQYPVPSTQYKTTINWCTYDMGNLHSMVGKLESISAHVGSPKRRQRQRQKQRRIKIPQEPQRKQVPKETLLTISTVKTLQGPK